MDFAGRAVSQSKVWLGIRCVVQREIVKECVTLQEQDRRQERQ
jgi:hypothetical protein